MYNNAASCIQLHVTFPVSRKRETEDAIRCHQIQQKQYPGQRASKDSLDPAPPADDFLAIGLALRILQLNVGLSAWKWSSSAHYLSDTTLTWHRLSGGILPQKVRPSTSDKCQCGKQCFTSSAAARRPNRKMAVACHSFTQLMMLQFNAWWHMACKCTR